MIHPEDLPRWKAKLDQIAVAYDADATMLAEQAVAEAERPARNAEARAILEDFWRTGDFHAFRAEASKWSRRPGPHSAFQSFGQMWLNQVAKRLLEGDTATVRTIADALVTPSSIEESVEKINAVAGAIQALPGKYGPAPARVPYVLSMFWTTDPVDTSWPVLWPSAANALYGLGWTRSQSNVDRWVLCVELSRAVFGDDAVRLNRLLWYADAYKFTGLNPALSEMCAEAADLMGRHRRGVGYADDATSERAESLAHQILAETRSAGVGLLDDLMERLGRDDLTSQSIDLRIAFEKTGAFRADGHTVWAVTDEARAPSLRLWATRSGVALGLHVYDGVRGTSGLEIAASLSPLLPDGVRHFRIEPHLSGDRLRPTSAYEGGDVFVGSWWPWARVPEGLALRNAVIDGAEALGRAFDVVARPPQEVQSEFPPAVEEVVVDEIDRVGKVAQELLLPEEFLREIEELLLDKGQVVFYGPPGTGKTYVADRIAEAIQPDPERRLTVQFHPSISYEDFFEGYRPRLEAGQMTYELRRGPLALLAQRAATAPGVPHVLVIDELNRAALPRVFGELLYLLEYRNKEVRTAYRPDTPFRLPSNLYLIGTMNTADRSVAVIDAALRRRFHFIPFVPHEGPLSGVLRSWLKKQEEPGWIAGLVDGVNDALRVLLQGAHLLVGHSHFLVAGAGPGRPTVLTEQRLRRTWDYGIYPMIEDQLHGRPDQLAEFTWDAVLERFGPGTPAAEEEADTVEALLADELAAEEAAEREPTTDDVGPRDA